MCEMFVVCMYIVQQYMCNYNCEQTHKHSVDSSRHINALTRLPKFILAVIVRIANGNEKWQCSSHDMDRYQQTGLQFTQF